MSKSWVVFAFLPILAGCAATPAGPQSAQSQCQSVDQDNTDSHIKVKNECTSSQGSSNDAAHPNSKLAPR